MTKNQELSCVDEFLAEMTRKPEAVRGNLIFALDATGSRERSWDVASRLQVQMFKAAAGIGSLDIQLVYYRGMDGFGGECKASGWVSDSRMLTKLMGKIRCESCETQIGKVLNHALRAANQRKINAVIFVGDACEEQRDSLVKPARQLAELGVPVFMFQEGHDQIARLHFQEVARLTHGAYHQFNAAAAQQLAELLRAVAVFATGGIKALEQQDSAAARLLLGQIR